MSRKILTAIASVVVAVMIAIPFIAPRGKTEVQATKVDPAFGAYISAYTSGIISDESYIRITLASEYTGPVTLDKPADEDYFSFDPGIPGKTYWLDTRTLEFRPDARLASDKVYNCEFRLGKLITDIPEQFRTMKFSFRTMKQGFNVSVDGMKTTDRKTMRWQQMSGTLTTNDAADPKIVEQMLAVAQDNHALHVKWIHEGDNVTHHFTVDSIARRDREGKVTLTTDGKALGVEQKNSSDIKIPSLKDFKVTDVRLEQGEEQSVVVEFSDPLQEKQNLDGLVTLKGVDNLRFSIEDNDVRIFPPSQLSGDYTLTVTHGVKNILGFSLPNSFTQVMTFEELKPQVKLVGKGVILPNSKAGLLFPFQAVSLKAVDVKIIRIYENNIPQFLQVNSLDGSSELYRVGKVVVKKKVDLNIKSKADYSKWTSFSLDLGEMIKAEPGAIYRVSIGFRKSYAVYNCAGDTTTNSTIANDDQDNSFSGGDDDEDDDNGYGYYGGDYYDDEYYYYDDGDRADPCDDSYYYGKTVNRNILASDLGLIAKRGNDGSMLFAVNNLLTTDPVEGAQLEVYDFQHQLLTTTKSDEKGMARISLPKKKPFLLVAKNGDQRGYLKLDEGSSLSVSAFDVGGQQVQKGLKGFIYGERGVWRPGDTLFLGFILEDKQNQLPLNHPVTFELNNSRGQLVSRVVKAESVNGFYTFPTPTDPDAPTGYWSARVKVGGAVFTKDIRVEAIMPNRLKINLDFGKQKFLTEEGDQTVKLDSRWLMGATAKNLKTQVDVSFYKTTTTFKGYDNYVFDDPATNFATENKTVFDGHLDENGTVSFDPKLSADNAPGKLRASFFTRVFEEGGAFSSDRFSIDFSPYKYYVGLLVPKGSGWGGMLETGKDQGMRVVTVDENGNPVSREHLQVKVYKVDWRWWWSDGYDDLAQYVTSDYYQPYYEQEISTKNGVGSFKLNVANEDYGRYLIRVTDDAGHSTGSLAWFDWPYWDGSGTGNNDIASLLSFSSDKKQYKVGDNINLTIPSPGQGRALISIENGSKIIDAFWAQTEKKGNITWTIPVTSEMAPNVYINVTLIQPHAQVKNDAPIRLYGVIPIIVDDPKTHLTPMVSVPAVWKPEEQASVSVSEKDGKAMTYTIAVVDEGLLDLTRFQTPDPWGNFYAREALGVKSWDMYDMVMGAYGAEMGRVLGIGGDGDAGPKGGQKANRFKPMVKFMGPFVLTPGERKTTTFMMPQYVGSVRVMVIAGQDNAYGNAEKTVAVRKPLMILGTLPRVVGPGETVDLPVDVFAMEKKVKNVTVAVTKNSMFSVSGESTKTTTFSDIGDNIVTFRLLVANSIGLGKVKITASGGGERAEYDIELDVRSPNPPMTDVTEAIIEPNQSWSSDYTPNGIAGTNEGMLEVSTIPALNLGQRLNYLITYPYGCVEQTTSSVFPQLYLSDLMDIDATKQSKIDNNIRAGIDRLRKFQTSSGGLSYWPGQNEPSEWGSNYAGHFLLEAQAKGYTLPAGLIDGWKKFQKDQAVSWSPRYDTYYYGNDQLIQAYRLYTLALANAPELGAMNRLREVPNLNVAAKWRLAAAYKLAGQQEIASQLVAGLSTTVAPYTELSWTYGSDQRDEAMILETLSLLGGANRIKGAPIAKSISEDLSNHSYWMSTQTTAYCLIALSKFSGTDKGNKGVMCDYTIDGKAGKVNQSKPLAQVGMNIRGTQGGKITVKNNGSAVLFARIILTGVPAAGAEKEEENNMGLTVQFSNLNGTPVDVSRIPQGDDFIATVTIYNPGVRGEYREMALTQIFPSGWEIRNLRMEDSPDPVTSDPYDYQDIRDDRIYTYFWIGPRKTRTYRVLLNAAYSGHFYMPATSCEAMYDHSINARRAGQWVDVVKSAGDIQ